MRRHLMTVLLGVLAVGCHTTVVRSGLPAGRTPPGYDSHWHHAFLLGVADASGAYDLDQLCPEGWSEIRTERDFTTGLMTVLTGWVYAPQRVTLVCAAPSEAGPEVSYPPAEGPLPPAR